MNGQTLPAKSLPAATDPGGFYGADPTALPIAKGPEDMPDAPAGSIFGAAFDRGFMDLPGSNHSNLQAAYAPITAELETRHPIKGWLGTNIAHDLYYPPLQDGGLPQPINERQIWADIVAERKRDPKFLPGVPATIDEFHASIAKDQRTAGAQDDAITARARGVTGTAAWLGGGAAAQGMNPINYLPLPGGPAKSIAGKILFHGATNAGLVGLAQPFTAAERAERGETLTLGEAGSNMLFGGVFGAGMQAAGHAAVPIARGLVDATMSRLRPRDVAGPGVAPEAHAPGDVPGLDPDEQAAAHVLTRDADITETSPFRPGADGEAHAERMAMAQRALAIGPERETVPRGTVSRAPEPNAGPAPREQVKALIRGHESGGNPNAANPLSTARGLYQFTRPTWNRYRTRVAPDMGEAEWQAKHSDPATQERVMDVAMGDYAHSLRRIGAPETPGNLYLMHFAGEQGGEAVLRADPYTPIARVLGEGVVDRNPFLRGMTAGDVVAWAHRVMHDSEHPGPMLRRDLFPEGDAGGEEWASAQADIDRSEAELQQNRRDLAGLRDDGDAPVPRETLRDVPREPAEPLPSPIEELGGDAATLPMPPERPLPESAPAESVTAAKPATVKPARARQPETVLEYIAGAGGLRDDEGHGLTPAGRNNVSGRRVRSSRDLGMRVRGFGPLVRAVSKGMSVDAAGEMLHEAGFFTERPTTADVLDMVDRAGGGEKIYPLHRQAEIEARQAERARKVDEEYYREHVIDRIGEAYHPDAAEVLPEVMEEVASGAEPYDAYIAAINRRISEALDKAAEDFGDRDYEHDLAPDGAAEAPEAVGGPAGDAGAARGSGDAGEGAAVDRGQAGGPAHEVAPDRAAWARFDDPDGEGAKAQADSLEHDLRMQVDPNIAERQRQQAALKAKSPLQSTAEQQGTIGSPLFDAADQPSFRIEEEGAELSPQQILDEIDAEDRAIDSLEACMQPPKPGAGA